MSRDFVGALLQLNAEKQISREQLIGAVEDGIQSAYRRVAGDEDIHVRIDAETGKIRVFRARRVVDEIEDEFTEITVEQAHAIEPDAGLGDLVETEQLDGDVFGRIGAQTAKQIVLQRIREVERDQVFDQFASREGELITGTVNRVEPRAIILDVGKNVEAILATTEQTALEHYRIGQNVKAFVLEVRRSTKGPQIFVSRTHKGFLKRLFELEVPEIHSGTVEIKAIAREAGSRSKVAVASRQDGLDPVGATVGQRGARVQAVVAELSGEKIDVIPWSDDAGRLRGQRAEPGPGDLGRHRRGAPDRERDRPRADAVAGHRPRGPERPARGPADRLADRHPQRRVRRRGQGRAPTPSRRAPRAPETPRRAARARGRRATPRSPSACHEGRRAAPSDRRGRTGRRPAEAPAAKPKRVTKKACGRRPRGRAPRPPRRPRAEPTRSRPPEADAEPREPRPTAKPKRAPKKAAVPSGGGGVVGRGRRGRVAPRRVPTRTCVACRTAVRSVSCCASSGRRTARSSLDPSGRARRTRRLCVPTGTCLDTGHHQGRPEPGADDPAPGRPARRARPRRITTDTIIEGGARGQE